MSSGNRRIAAAGVLAATLALTLPPASNASQNRIYVDNNVESSVHQYRNCRYRVQIGQFGTAAYGQLKLLNRSCVSTGVDYHANSCSRATDDTLRFPDTCTVRGFIAVAVVRAGDSDEAFTNVTSRGPRVFQATFRNAFITGVAGYTVCSTSSTGQKCDFGTVRFR